MKAIQISEISENAEIRLVETAEPKPRPGEVLVEVKAVGVN